MSAFNFALFWNFTYDINKNSSVKFRDGRKKQEVKMAKVKNQSNFLTVDDVVAMRSELKPNVEALAARYSCSASSVRRVLRYEIYKDVVATV